MNTYPKGKQGSVIVWAAIGGSIGKTELIIMERDETSNRGGYSTKSYLSTLEMGLVPIYIGQVFIEDNTPIHTSHKSHEALENWGITRLKGLERWPPYSPDLNPIEHLWPRLKEKVYDIYPGIDDVKNKEEQKRILCDVLPQAWALIPKDIVDRCLSSMPDRIQAVIDAEGWRTRF